ncbi:hypothetical protein TPHA_0D00760 [Tetrapisispora phaffii CBS 4417]|uniref:Pseudouridine synthase I TruA alpha/beta domain-containing protein n=1 Tax=Tetrapisispora phaffii (strain ATCC 24235 / CBS 4417 / NBRC 1672 / NRRL Y-8282 / UCD 70-5) TaxID=1071381 RepID=G8BS98_TETPH|nr:hypothetical protein TPHA_0D00760 [Tetrapisispora phaffii CBS 4417]CCE62719.1 hypothetical protein TPHA_0D00760 [Tetrapisispora phaffii CBS 4417]
MNWKYVTNILRHIVPNASKSDIVKIGNKYENWTKQQLIDRLQALETLSNSNITAEYHSQNSDIKKDNLTIQRKKHPKEFNFEKYHKRHVALKFCYLGWDYNGLALQKDKTPLPTIEGILLEAMKKCKFIPSMNPKDFKFSRCGRTDKGVSALNQIISLDMRSELPPAEQVDANFDHKEINYTAILNQILPPAIRITAVCLNPPKDFDARFNCISRHYKYFFKLDNLDITLMREAAKHFEGENDFRNFCKLDGSKQIKNYERTIFSFDISKVKEDIYCFDIIASAFLWHQVRYMVAILFLVGQKLEPSSIVKDLLDVNKYPRKPIYDMAADFPLVLYDCNYSDMKWIKSNINDYKAIKFRKSLEAIDYQLQIKATIASIFLEELKEVDNNTSNKTRICTGDGHGNFTSIYSKIEDRLTMRSFEEINENYRKKHLE